MTTKPLPKWVFDDRREMLEESLRGGLTPRERQIELGGYERAIRLVLDSLEKTKEKDGAEFNPAVTAFNEGRESVRKEVLND